MGDEADRCNEEAEYHYYNSLVSCPKCHEGMLEVRHINGKRVLFTDNGFKHECESKVINSVILKTVHKTELRGATVQVVCRRKGCGVTFTARVADRKRGWGQFCCKSCKAIYANQTKGMIWKGIDTH